MRPLLPPPYDHFKVRGLSDLKARLGRGRRCYALFHPRAPNEPLVFVHVALLPKVIYIERVSRCFFTLNQCHLLLSLPLLVRLNEYFSYRCA